MKLHTIVQACMLTCMLIFMADTALGETSDFQYVNCATIRTISAEDAALLVAWLHIRHEPSDELNIDFEQIRRDTSALRAYCETHDGAPALASAIKELFATN